MTPDKINKWDGAGGNPEKMPVLFVGHGSPMNAIEENEFVSGWREVSKKLPLPAGVLCISAHWETRGPMVTVMEHPRTIHDFGGFPRALYDIQYPAPGDPELATTTQEIVTTTKISPDEQWGLDHGCWSVLRRMYPGANIPVVQLSLDYTRAPKYHYEMAKELAPLREKGLLVLCSGNIVHNLRMVSWNRLNEPGFGFDWALEANNKMKDLILTGDHKSLIDFRSQGRAFDLAIPTPEHFLPLLYALALQDEKDNVEFFNDKAVGGSLTMTSLVIGH